MIRFRNPSSSLETMLASFGQLYEELKDKEYFDNDDIALMLAKANLMASSGFTGDAALSLGANKDRSRDKTYNNAKMFAETFRLLGLISVVNNVSSNYRFTYIGEHMVAPNADKKAIVEQCILGMNNPNKIMDVSYDESVRFFSCVLLTMDQLDGYICRDEMILGPMCVNDNSPAEFAKMIKYIRGIRGDFSKLQSELESLAKSLQGNKKGGMSVTSVQNCTRFPISVLKYCNWVDSENLNIYGKSVRFMKLTSHGRDTVKKLKMLQDIRLQFFATHVQQLHKKYKSVDQLVEYIVEEHINDKKTEFYPLVETLFRIIGVDCHKSRDGVNGERWDAMIRDSKRSIPIEIKSPTEEMHISVKAIRQALENKIILLSRKTYITTNECSTYAVGYFPPNDRAEVSDLIENIKKTFGYSIAVFDIGSLIKVSVNIILFNKGIDLEEFLGRKIHVSVGYFGILENMK